MTLRRIIAIGVIGLVLAWLTRNVFAQLLGPLLLAPLLPVMSASVLAGRRVTVRAAGAAGAVIVTVGAIVLIEGGSFGDTWRSLGSGVRLLLTTEWPSPVLPTVVGAVALVVALSTAVGCDLAGQPRLHLLPLAPPLVGLAAILALGAPLRPPVWTLVLLGALALLVAADRPDEPFRDRWRTLSGDHTLLVSALVIGVAAVVASGAIAWADRADPRRTEEADITVALLDPIEATVALRRLDPPIDLFRISDRSRLINASLPARWRLAALDSYDGQRWVPRVTLRPIGGRLGLPTDADATRIAPIDYSLDILTDDIDLVPFPGRPLSIDAAVQTDADRTVVRLTDRPDAGDSLLASSEIAPSARQSITGSVVTRPVDEIAGTFDELANNLGGDGTLLDRLQAIEQTLRSDWELDSGAPGGGLQRALVERFTTETRRGTSEQFVTAFVLLARSLGVNARVATGFIVPPDEIDSPITLRSSYATVWPEVQLDDGGWLAFDPVPDRETTDEEEPPPPPEAQSPAAVQPPIAPPTDQAEDTEELAVDDQNNESGLGRVLAVVQRVGLVTGLAILPIALGIGTIIWLKWRRRRRRLRVADPASRVRGAWANATDSLVDAGLTIAPSWTDDHIAEAAVPLAPTVPHEMRRLAGMSTAMTFGATEHGQTIVRDALITSAAVDDAIRTERTMLQRVRWRISLRSLRHATRSPVLTE